jgi:hypothetical protein
LSILIIGLFGKEYKYKVPHCAVLCRLMSSFLGPDILSTVFSKTLGLCFSQVSQPHKLQTKL